MKRTLTVAGCIAISAMTAFAGTHSERETVNMTGNVHVEARRVHVASAFGVTDEVLSDTNRFMIGEGRCGSQAIKLDEPFGGFRDVEILLDDWASILRHDTNGKPHRLNSVTLTRQLSDTLTEKELVAEWQASCDFVSGILGVESPQVRLVDVEKWRDGTKIAIPIQGITSCVTFDLADNQIMVVRITEPWYAMRNGKTVVVRPGCVSIVLRLKSNPRVAGVPHLDDDDKKVVEKEIDFGPDCREKLAAELKNGVKRRPPRKRYNIVGGKAKSN